jgi:hypothetical protein
MMKIFPRTLGAALLMTARFTLSQVEAAASPIARPLH